jgi:hypothetical protein
MKIVIHLKHFKPQEMLFLIISYLQIELQFISNTSLHKNSSITTLSSSEYRLITQNCQVQKHCHNNSKDSIPISSAVSKDHLASQLTCSEFRNRV